MRFHTYFPKAPFSRYIQSYWTMEDRLSSTHHELVYPTGITQVIFHYGTPFIDSYPSGKSTVQPRSLICGQMTGYKTVLASDVVGMFGIVFYPWGLKPFVRIPMSELTDQSVALNDLSAGLQEIEERIADYGTTEERIVLVEDWLGRMMHADESDGMKLAAYCANRIIGRRGQLSIPDVLNETDTGERRLERLFLDNVGMSPRQFIGIARFNFAVSLMSKHERLTDIAYDAGYFDQAHFIRSFRRYMGYSPKEYRLALHVYK